MLAVKGKKWKWVYRATGRLNDIVRTGSRLGNCRSWLSCRLVINLLDDLEQITQP
jgi:hypothetical protein